MCSLMHCCITICMCRQWAAWRCCCPRLQQSVIARIYICTHTHGRAHTHSLGAILLHTQSHKSSSGAAGACLQAQGSLKVALPMVANVQHPMVANMQHYGRKCATLWSQHYGATPWSQMCNTPPSCANWRCCACACAGAGHLGHGTAQRGAAGPPS